MIENFTQLFVLSLCKLPYEKTKQHIISSDIKLDGFEPFSITFESSPEVGLPYGGLGRALIICINDLVYRTKVKNIRYQEIIQVLKLKTEDEIKEFFDQLTRWQHTRITINRNGESYSFNLFSLSDFN